MYVFKFLDCICFCNIRFFRFYFIVLTDKISFIYKQFKKCPLRTVEISKFFKCSRTDNLLICMRLSFSLKCVRFLNVESDNKH